MELQELSELLGDLVLVGSDSSHLSSDGVHVLAQGNPVLLRLMPVGIEAGGQRMDLVS